MEISPPVRISVDHVFKQFNIGVKRKDGVLSNIVSAISGRESRQTLPVLQGISFTASAGENIGLIGSNGSGKSTLLRLIAGIYQADSGTIKTRGELAYLNGFGFGLRPKMTMHDNIYLAGLLMGLSRKEIRQRFWDIVKFAELENFVDTKIFQFSSGMLSRLSFSITFHCLEQKTPDIVLLDEVFGAGGDLAFQNKALAQMEKFIQGGTTVIIVSHNLDLIERYCHRVVLLDKGSVLAEGPAATVIKQYQDLINNF